MEKNTIADRLISSVIIAIVAVFSVVFVLKAVGPLPLSVTQTTTEKQSTFDVTGESEMSVIPDNAEVTLGIDTRNKSISAAQQQANATITAIQNALTDLGIEKKDIKTENYNVYPEYDYTNPNRRITGYSVNTSIRVNVKDFEKLNTIIDSATAAGANQVGGIQFVLSPEKENEVKKEARIEAIAMAQENAKELSTLAGMRLGKIVNVRETPQQQIFPMMGRADLATINKDVEQMAQPTDIQPGSTKYTYTVILSFETL